MPGENGVQIESLSADQFTPSKGDLGYVDVFQLHDLFEKMAFRANIILVGPKGIGKSFSVASFAAKTQTPLITFDCSEDVRRGHLIGHCMLRGDETPFVLGPLTTAFEVANEKGSCILNLEEVNALTPQMQKVLNSVADFRQKLEVPEAKKVFRLREGAKLWITASMNTSVYGGVYELNQDLKSRFRMISLDYPEAKVELNILKAQETLKSAEDRMLKSLCALAHETRQNALEYPLSTRDLIQIAEDATVIDLNTALRIALGKFEGDDRETVKRRMQSSFSNVSL